MYEDVLKEKENLGIKLVQGEEEKNKMAREHELLGKKVSENGRVCMINVNVYISCRKLQHSHTYTLCRCRYGLFKLLVRFINLVLVLVLVMILLILAI